jgi:D-aspartate ligase
MPGKNPAAIVLELGVNGLGVVRSLANKGIEIFGIYTEEGPGCFSRYCKAVRVPSPSGAEAHYIQALVEICERMGVKPVLFPTNDRTVSLVSKYRDVLQPVSLFALPEEDVLERVINKDGTKGLAVECGIKIPKTYLVKNIIDLQSAMAEATFPVIFKPKDTFSVKLPLKEKNLTFHSREELLEYFDRYSQFISNGVFQEVIRGGDGYVYVCAGYFDNNADPLSVYTGRKIRQYLPDYGITCCGESMSLPEIRQMTVDFMKKANYKGLAAIEYVKEKSTGEYYFLEINARSYYHNSLFLSCGINLPYTCYLDLTQGGRLEEDKEIQKNGVVWVDFNRDLASFLIKYRKRQIGFSDWLPSILKARSFAVFDPNDIRPFLYNARCLFGSAWDRFRGKDESTVQPAPSASPPSI